MDLDVKPRSSGATETGNASKAGKRNESGPYYDFSKEPEDSFRRSSHHASETRESKPTASSLEKKLKENPDTHGIGNRDIEPDNSELDSLLHELEDIENQAMGKPRKAHSGSPDPLSDS